MYIILIIVIIHAQYLAVEKKTLTWEEVVGKPQQQAALSYTCTNREKRCMQYTIVYKRAC